MRIKILLLVVVVLVTSSAVVWHNRWGGAVNAQPTDANCYDEANAGKVGDGAWAGCAGTYIVTDLTELKAGVSNGFKITHNGVDYAFGDSVNNVFTGQVTSFSRLFVDQATFNADISGWDTSQVTNMAWMFFPASAFNADIAGWDTSQVTDMSAMFMRASAFNADISGWDTSQVTDM